MSCLVLNPTDGFAKITLTANSVTHSNYGLVDGGINPWKLPRTVVLR